MSFDLKEIEGCNSEANINLTGSSSGRCTQPCEGLNEDLRIIGEFSEGALELAFAGLCNPDFSKHSCPSEQLSDYYPEDDEDDCDSRCVQDGYDEDEDSDDFEDPDWDDDKMSY